MYIFEVFIEYPLNLGSGCISMFSVNLTVAINKSDKYKISPINQDISDAILLFFSEKIRHFRL